MNLFKKAKPQQPCGQCGKPIADGDAINYPCVEQVAFERHKELMETFGKLLAAQNAANDHLTVIEAKCDVLMGQGGALGSRLDSLATGEQVKDLQERFPTKLFAEIASFENIWGTITKRLDAIVLTRAEAEAILSAPRKPKSVSVPRSKKKGKR